MENTNKLIKMIFSILIFCSGLALMFYGSKTYHDALRITRQLVGEDVLYQQYNNKDLLIVPYSQLITMLFQPLEYDIMVDGINIKKTEHNTDKISSYGIRHTNYLKSYRYNENGAVIMIVYTGIN